MKKSFLIFLSSVALASLLVACTNTNETEKEPTQENIIIADETPSNTEFSVKEDVDKDIINEVTETQTNSSEKPDEASVEPKKQVVVHSGDEAMDYLKTQIPEGTNEDVIFGAAQELETDEKGSYYFVRLSSLSLRLQGGTGTLDTYKVYQDGHYETMY